MAVHHGTLTHADKHGRHSDGQHTKHGIGNVKTSTGLIGNEQSCDTKHRNHNADAERGLSRVMACHRRFFDRAYVSEGLRRDGDQDAEHDLRNACVQFLIHSFLSKKDKHRRLLQGLFEKESLVFSSTSCYRERLHMLSSFITAFRWVPYAAANV